ncbi:hypothetical protein ESZ50_04765 [Weissella muntiaci]|uniref:Uncharacterized protein n=1 Tax=Weissella muntiaci TaxID=2508881 RepID=A0A6C2C7R4_9LACO|nr:hypothetical protein [Weissella muntiaci]TYC49907.1 hypothetical protein ESZ50_04765 [Weissella muntiaci]
MYEVIDEFPVIRDEVLLTVSPRPKSLRPGDKLETINGTFKFLHYPMGVRDPDDQLTIAAKKLM